MADAQAKMSHQMREAEHSARRTVRMPWVQALARFGFACKGIVYLVMGPWRWRRSACAAAPPPIARALFWPSIANHSGAGCWWWLRLASWAMRYGRSYSRCSTWMAMGAMRRES
jgi:hypothetical protein